MEHNIKCHQSTAMAFENMYHWSLIEIETEGGRPN